MNICIALVGSIAVIVIFLFMLDLIISMFRGTVFQTMGYIITSLMASWILWEVSHGISEVIVVPLIYFGLMIGTVTVRYLMKIFSKIGT